jgi:hypothetical protein
MIVPSAGMSIARNVRGITVLHIEN